MKFKKPELFSYCFAQAISWLAATILFRRRFLRNELRGKRGPFVVIANHEAALDFVNLIGATPHRMHFVISNSFYRTLPIRRLLDRIGVIPKQQFQTSVADLRRMKEVIHQGRPLVIYPAGLMCEDGLSTPIPRATYKFLQWLDADVYVARSYGSYFVMPKWANNLRPGRTYLDIYRLFEREELATSSLAEIQQKTDEALLYDAYREQERFGSTYQNGRSLQGLQHVLYQCPHCQAEFTVVCQNDNELYCTACGYHVDCDKLSFLHKKSVHGPELRYISDWSRQIHDRLKARIAEGALTSLSTKVKIQMIDPQKPKFREAGEGLVTLTPQEFRIEGMLHGQPANLSIPIAGIPTLPFKPGKHFEIQHGPEIYRCLPEDGRLVMKMIHMLKIFYEETAMV